MGYVARRRTTENEVGTQFQKPLEEAFADFCRMLAFVAGIVIGGHGEEIGLAFRKIKEGVARDFSCHEG